MNTRYVLKTEDGRMVTHDTRRGPALTVSRALCYVWETPESAEAKRFAYQAMLRVALTVEPLKTGTVFEL